MRNDQHVDERRSSCEQRAAMTIIIVQRASEVRVESFTASPSAALAGGQLLERARVELERGLAVDAFGARLFDPTFVERG